jgi:hypothetical protein
VIEHDPHDCEAHQPLGYALLFLNDAPAAAAQLTASRR